METNVSNYHPIGRDPESYHSGALVEAVTLKNITPSELIGRYNLMLERIAEQTRRLDEALEAISASSDALDGAGLGGCYASQACRAWLSATAPRESENAING